MNMWRRLVRHARIAWQNYQALPSPPFLILFLTSRCNMRCEHCFYWRSLNQKDDLTLDELIGLSCSLGRVENLSLSGGEPFLRPELAEVCRQFIRRNQVRQIYVPTNGYFTERIIEQVSQTLEERDLELFAVELSLDGTANYHDRLRVMPGAFERAIATYNALVDLQERDPRLRIHAASTATNANLGEIERLSRFLYDRCPRMDHHNLAIVRGDRKDPSLLTPELGAYNTLYRTIQQLWQPREAGRYGAIVEPMMQWAKVQTLLSGRQFIPCRAGKLETVVYANGDVGVCELREPLGNLRSHSFLEIWNSEEAHQVRRSIARGECHCTTEVFMWPSIVYSPLQLVRAMVGARVWRRPPSLTQGRTGEPR